MKFSVILSTMKFFDCFIILWTCIVLRTCSTQECPSAKADVVFVVDDSTSVQILNFKLVLKFIQDVVQTLPIGPDAVQVGFVSFSNSVQHQFFFNEYTDKTSLIEKIGAVRFRGGGTDIGKALSETFQAHFQDPASGVRDEAAKVLVLITDGSSTGTADIASTIRNARIDILCVGISSGIDLKQLEDIAGAPSKVFDASSFSLLGNITGLLSSKTCDAIQPEINACESSPCQHSGTCVNHGGGDFGCLCTRQYLGPLCELQVDQCDPNPCKNGASCSSTLESFTCHCTPQFKGTLCDEEIKPCESMPCLNSGRCEESGENFICHCLPDFTGQTCETEISACFPNPCQNEADCKEENKMRPVCFCKEGFGDIYCQTGNLIPKVAEVGKDANVSCLNTNSNTNVEPELDINDPQRQERQTDKDLLLRHIGKSDIHRNLLCHYISDGTNTTTSVNIPLIVVEKTVETTQSSTKFTCTVYSVLKKVSVTIATDSSQYRLKDVQTETNLMDGEVNTAENGAEYNVDMYSTSVIVNTTDADIRCFVYYKSEEIWVALLSEKKEVPPKVTENKGFPVWAWILLGLVIAGVIIAIIAFNVCKSCRLNAAAARKRKLKLKPGKEEEGEELKELEKQTDPNSIEVENGQQADDSKAPLKSDIQEKNDQQ